IEDESNLSDAYARNFIRLHIAPLLTARYPRWREALARAARHFARSDADARVLLREFLAAKGLRAPSEAKLVEMLRQLTTAALGGELRFRRARGEGIDARWLEEGELQVKMRAGGERLQPDARRPRRTLKNLFQEAGVPPWERERLPLLYRRDELVWAPGFGVD